MIRRAMMYILLVTLAASMFSCAGCRKKPIEVAQPPVAETPVTDPGDTGRAVTPEKYSSEGYLNKIFFDYDKAGIRADQLKNAEANAEWLIAHPDMKVLVEGHCDERGTVEYNLGLGQRRATTVQEFLVKKGVNAENISVISKGEEEPLDPGNSEAAWAKNRRAEFWFLTPPPAK